VQSYVLPNLDYCNAMYFGLNSSLMAKLQTVQNNSARFVCNDKTRKHFKFVTSSKSLTKELHLLPLNYRVKYKIALLVFKCLHGKAPFYLRDLVKTKTPNSQYALRPINQLNLLDFPPNFPTYKKSKYGFRYSAPAVWNSLPLDTRSLTNLNKFKKSLKTHYFRLAYVN